MRSSEDALSRRAPPTNNELITPTTHYSLLTTTMHSDSSARAKPESRSSYVELSIWQISDRVDARYVFVLLIGLFFFRFEVDSHGFAWISHRCPSISIDFDRHQA